MRSFRFPVTKVTKKERINPFPTIRVGNAFMRSFRFRVTKMEKGTDQSVSHDPRERIHAFLPFSGDEGDKKGTDQSVSHDPRRERIHAFLTFFDDEEGKRNG